MDQALKMFFLSLTVVKHNCILRSSQIFIVVHDIRVCRDLLRAKVLLPFRMPRMRDMSLLPAMEALVCR